MKKLTALFFCILVSVSQFGAAAQKGSEYSQVIIYYYDWDVRTRSALTIADVRSQYFLKTEISHLNYIHTFIETLPELNGVMPNSSSDVRLVIDLLMTDGRKLTYFASRFDLCLEGSAKCVAIDESFRSKFRFRY